MRAEIVARMKHEMGLIEEGSDPSLYQSVADRVAAEINHGLRLLGIVNGKVTIKTHPDMHEFTIGIENWDHTKSPMGRPLHG